ncbi:MAG: nuclear transport factor 2 family protein [Rhodocyclaceae bacterium]
MSHVFDDPQQQEVWSVVRALNDDWTQSDGSRLDTFFHRDMIAITPVDRHRREGREQCVAGWQQFCRHTRIRSWKEIDPVIRIYGDCAIVAYDYEIVFEAGGNDVVLTGRDLFTFVQEDGRWWAVADQFSAHPR